jgi:hypothetical protein
MLEAVSLLLIILRKLESLDLMKLKVEERKE